MIDLTKVEFEESPSKYYPDSTQIKARLPLLAWHHVSNKVLNKARKETNDVLRAKIHRRCYGDLMPRLWEVVSYALKYSPRTESVRLEKTVAELRALLSSENWPLDLSKTELSPQEDYWLAVQRVAEKLPFEQRVPLVQSLIMKFGPPPPNMDYAVKILMTDWLENEPE